MARSPATTRPIASLLTTQAAVAPHQSVRRLTTLRAVLLGLQQEYEAGEGPNRRGKRFEALVGAIDSVRWKEPPLTEMELLEWLGPPDYGDSDERGASYLYLYDRFGAKDWYVEFELDRNGNIREIGYNATSTRDLKTLRPFSVLHLAKVGVRNHAVVGDGYVGIQLGDLEWHQDGHVYVGSFGVAVGAVAANSPAARAGIKSGDRILKLDGKRVEANEFRDRVVQLRPGQVVTFSVLRKKDESADPEERKIEVTIGSRSQQSKP
jgi:hypothetical protein